MSLVKDELKSKVSLLTFQENFQTHTDIVRTLMPKLSDSTYWTRHAAKPLFAQIFQGFSSNEREETLDAWQERLFNGDAFTRQTLLEAYADLFPVLATQEQEPVLNNLLLALSADEPKVRSAAIKTLGKVWAKIHSAETQQSVANNLSKMLTDDKSSEVREAAVLAIKKIAADSQDPELQDFLVDQLIAALEDPDQEVSFQAARALGKKIPHILRGETQETALATLVHVMSMPEPEGGDGYVKREIVRQLTDICAFSPHASLRKEALKGLLVACSSDGRGVKSDAREALRELIRAADGSHTPLLGDREFYGAALFQYPDAELWGHLLALTTQKSPQKTANLTEVRKKLSDADWQVRKAAVPALRRAFDTEDKAIQASIVAELRALIQDKSSDVRNSAIVSLGKIFLKIEDPAMQYLVLDDLIAHMFHPSDYSSSEAVETLRKLLPSLNHSLQEHILNGFYRSFEATVSMHKLLPTVSLAFNKTLAEALVNTPEAAETLEKLAIPAVQQSGEIREIWAKWRAIKPTLERVTVEVFCGIPEVAKMLEKWPELIPQLKDDVMNVFFCDLEKLPSDLTALASLVHERTVRRFERSLVDNIARETHSFSGVLPHITDSEMRDCIGKLLLNAVSHPGEWVRRWAAEGIEKGIAMLSPPLQQEIVSQMVNALSDPDWWVRSNLIKALGAALGNTTLCETLDTDTLQTALRVLLDKRTDVHQEPRRYAFEILDALCNKYEVPAATLNEPKPALVLGFQSHVQRAREEDCSSEIKEEKKFDFRRP